MSQNDSSSLVSLGLEESDLRKLQELDPFQADGYQTLARVSLPVSIIYANEKGQETTDNQPLTLQLLTRSYRPPAKGKEPKEAQLQSLRVCLYSEEDIFLSMSSTVSNSSFEALKTKNQLNLQFRDFPQSLLGMLRNCGGGGEGSNRVCLRLSYEGTGRLLVVQETEYKVIELAELHFSACSLEKAHQSIIFRYNLNRTKLTMIENSVESIYRLLAEKNAPLLAYIQKTVGDA